MRISDGTHNSQIPGSIKGQRVGNHGAANCKTIQFCAAVLKENPYRLQ
jgi:hypothetical protein